MSTEQQTAVLNRLADDLGYIQGAALIDIEAGKAISTVSKKSGFNLEIAAAYNAEVIKQKRKAMEALKLKDDKLDEVIFELTTALHILRFIGTNYAVYVAVEKSQANLGMAKALISKHVTELAKYV